MSFMDVTGHLTVTVRAGEELDRIISQGYLAGYARHGNLGLPLETFTDQMKSITRKHVGANVSAEAAAGFLSRLHAEDLYLAIACARQSEAAWIRFGAIYRSYIRQLCHHVSPTGDAARELADSVLIDMFLPDASGQSRIGSYDGRSSLATWLRVVVNNRAINERQRKSNGVEQAGCIPEVVDRTALPSVEASLLAGRYARVIGDCLESACNVLTMREQLFLLWRYDEGLQLGHMARLLGVHQSTVTRQLDRLLKKLRFEVISALATKHQLSAEAIDECLSVILENPACPVPIFTFIRRKLEDRADSDRETHPPPVFSRTAANF